MKKGLAVLLILSLVLTLCACAKTPEQLLAAAGEALAEEKYTEAVDYLNELLVQEPENTEALSTLAEAYTAMGDNANAEAALSTLTALQPDNADFIARLADMYLANGKNTEALAQYDKLVELGGTPSDELYELWKSTSLFDITDDTVFNAKVDELYAKIEGACSYRAPDDNPDKIYQIKRKEQVQLFLAVLNIDCITAEQLHYITDYRSNPELVHGNFMFICEAIAMRNDANRDDYISLVDYYVGSDENIKLLEQLDKLAFEIYDNGKTSDESVEFLYELADIFINDIEYETQDKMTAFSVYFILNCIDINYFNEYGYYHTIFDNFYTYFDSKISEYNSALKNEIIDDIEANLSRLSTS